MEPELKTVLDDAEAIRHKRDRHRTAAIVVVVVLAFSGIAWSQVQLYRVASTTNQVAVNARINQAGLLGIACLLRLPPAGTPGGRTSQDVERCLSEFDRLLDEDRAANQ